MRARVVGEEGENWVGYEERATKRNWEKVIRSPLPGAVLEEFSDAVGCGCGYQGCRYPMMASSAKTFVQQPPKMRLTMLREPMRVDIIVV